MEMTYKRRKTIEIRIFQRDRLSPLRRLRQLKIYNLPFLAEDQRAFSSLLCCHSTGSQDSAGSLCISPTLRDRLGNAADKRIARLVTWKLHVGTFSREDLVGEKKRFAPVY